MNNKFIALLILVSSYSFSQTINDYQAVIIPLKYDLQKTENQYRLQTLTKKNLLQAGFQAFYADAQEQFQFIDRCALLNINVEKVPGFLTNKVFVTLKNCYGTEVFKSPVATSREKDYEKAYIETLNIAFETLYKLNYKYNGKTNVESKATIGSQYNNSVDAKAKINNSDAALKHSEATATNQKQESDATPISKSESIVNTTVNLLYAQPTTYGYQLVNGEPKVVMKLYKTSDPKVFTAKKGELQGVLVAKENQWLFEYYQDDILISDKVQVKF